MSEPTDPSIRASDAERERVADTLNEAVGEGRLTLEEFSQRVDEVYRTTTRAELERFTADLPAEGRGAAAPPERANGGKKRWKLAVLGGSDYKGRWRVPARIGFFAFLGGSTIDLCEAELQSGEVEITLVSVLGGSDVVVPKGVRVEVDSTDLLGGNTIKIDEDAVVANSPVVRVRAYSVLGGNDVRHPKERLVDKWRRLTD
ncbi:hypothetical protein FHX42_001045 [Saccharopolyspora lacisalsi]|uniref:DUF1707 and DUF2154 domain-containing protein n=1 Tax=Halosaccharopolyspora lacisalsi TaxID=1000566 RepID=A0A839DTV9_9PSEU|nr:DUF1707 domain-containing protein [Halosaccharopolyspora lacisalsi]MBA8823716.1 hypothetical protein [Halosaccharopolyspora lacisalsi]